MMTAVLQPKDEGQKVSLRRQAQLVSRLSGMLLTIGEGFVIAARHGALTRPNQPHHTKLVRYFCRRMCRVLGVQVQVHGEMPREHALWVSNHVSWIDIPVIGSVTRVFFLSKAEVAQWPLMGRLARAGGTLFIKRGSGDSDAVRGQIASFLQQKMPVLFFPEATTTDGKQVRRIHGRLLAAALETQTPIQPVVLCYASPAGILDQIVPFIGDVSFADHLQQVLSHHQPVIAHVMALEPIETVGHDIHSLTNRVQAQMREGLQQLQAKVLSVPVDIHHVSS
jgi:1-acyl-sn-glycerol-3-phosphate acyltransferase